MREAPRARSFQGLPGVALTAPASAPAAEEPPALYGFRPFPKRGGIVTNDLIDQLREDDVG